MALPSYKTPIHLQQPKFQRHGDCPNKIRSQITRKSQINYTKASLKCKNSITKLMEEDLYRLGDWMKRFLLRFEE